MAMVLQRNIIIPYQVVDKSGHVHSFRHNTDGLLERWKNNIAFRVLAHADSGVAPVPLLRILCNAMQRQQL